MSQIQMDEYYIELLHQYDEKGAFEYPSNFDGEALSAGVCRVVDALKKRTIFQLEIEDEIHHQDANYSFWVKFANLEVCSNNLITAPGVLFSNFGSLATIGWLEMLAAADAETVIDILTVEGFKYIPPTILDLPYDGVEAYEGFDIWYDRYFSWL